MMYMSILGISICLLTLVYFAMLDVSYNGKKYLEKVLQEQEALSKQQHLEECAGE